VAEVILYSAMCCSAAYEELRRHLRPSGLREPVVVFMFAASLGRKLLSRGTIDQIEQDILGVAAPLHDRYEAEHSRLKATTISIMMPGKLIRASNFHSSTKPKCQ
jgi:hypothetical protein